MRVFCLQSVLCAWEVGHVSSLALIKRLMDNLGDCAIRSVYISGEAVRACAGEGEKARAELRVIAGEQWERALLGSGNIRPGGHV